MSEEDDIYECSVCGAELKYDVDRIFELNNKMLCEDCFTEMTEEECCERYVCHSCGEILTEESNPVYIGGEYYCIRCVEYEFEEDVTVECHHCGNPILECENCGEELNEDYICVNGVHFCDLNCAKDYFAY